MTISNCSFFSESAVGYMYVHQHWKTSVCRGINMLTTHVPTLNRGLDGKSVSLFLSKHFT
jgi:hypothetical protein